MNIQANDRKKINTASLDHLFTQGEAGADEVCIELPLQYGKVDLTGLDWAVQLAGEEDSFIHKPLEKVWDEEKLTLIWVVDEDCTAAAGQVKITVVGISEDSKTVIKFDGASIVIKEASYGSFAPTPDTVAAALAQMQKLAQEADTAAKSAEESALAAQASADRSPYIGEDGFWYIFDRETGEYGKSEIEARGPQGPQGEPGGVTTAFGRSGEVTAQAGDYSVGQITGAFVPNLLDNTNFANPINQKGETAYSGAGYGIDRWAGMSRCVIELTGSGLCLSNSNPSVGSAYIEQRIDPAELEDGEAYTFAVTIDGMTHCVSGTKTETVYGQLDDQPYEILIAPSSGGYHVARVIVRQNETGSHTITAAALYKGRFTVETLPMFYPKSYAEELAACQRYYQLFSCAEARPAALIDYRPMMRAEPEMGTISIGEVTCYFADANL